MIEIETQTTEVEVINNVEVTGTSQVEVETVDLSDLDITVAKKEYVITGDDIYIPMLYDDAPQWMKDLVQVVVDVSISSGNQSLINNMNAILQDFAVSYVPLNQYTQTILDLGDEDTRINALIETLNSNFNDGLSEANAQIISLQLTKASKDEVVAQVIQTIAAQLADGASNIGSTIGRIDQAIADETSARALSLQTLTASLEDTNLDVTANAEVIQNALAYVGIDEAGASTGTGLSAYLEDSNGNIGGADSQLANSIRVTAEGVESKFAYNSIVNINGVYKKSGFGLTTNYTSGTGTEANPYVSEFWIDASRFKFTNSNVTGSVAPFTIDATGTTPQIIFNGKVAFTNVTGTSSLALTDMSNVTTIDGGKITTGSITANKINTIGLIAENISANEINGKTITGAVINGAVINGAVVKASYLDLDGELEVLTNYHITPAMYAANPSLYTDAVYIEGNNEYRIPSISTVRETDSIMNISAGGSIFNSKIRSYNCANAGHNNKCVKIQPSITVSVDVDFFDFNFHNAIPSAYKGITNTYKLYIANALVCSIYYIRDSITVESTEFYINGTKMNFSNDIIFNTAGQVIKLSFYDFNTYYNDSDVVSTYNYGIKATILSGVRTLSLNYDDTSKGLIYIENIGGNTIPNVDSYLRVTAKTNTYISINNMI